MAQKIKSNQMLDVLPIGVVLPYAGSTAPDGWMLCYGQIVSENTYEDLFNVTGQTYNTGGEGAGNFRLPDLRGRVIAGQDDMGGTSANRLTNPTGNTIGGIDGDVLGGTGGSETHTLTAGQLAVHSHPVNHNIYNQTGGTGGSFGNLLMLNNTGFQNVSLSTSNTGSDAPHNNVQPTIILNYIIKVS